MIDCHAGGGYAPSRGSSPPSRKESMSCCDLATALPESFVEHSVNISYDTRIYCKLYTTSKGVPTDRKEIRNPKSIFISLFFTVFLRVREGEGARCTCWLKV